MSTDDRLREFRERIDRIDADILRLLTERGGLAKTIGDRKSGQNEPVYAPHREHQVIGRLRELNASGVYPNEAIEAIFREIISASRALETPLRVAYLGPEASFTHFAARRHFGAGTELIAQPTQTEIFQVVERKQCQYGVVPVENSTMGVVIDTLDLFTPSPLRICAEIMLPIVHNLLSNEPLGRIEHVYSHHQAFAQCRRWLNAHLPGAEQTVTSSTSEAARLAASEPGSGAICSSLAADVYKLVVLEAHIEDEANNVTRFFVIGDQSTEPTGKDKTSIRFAVRDEVGALVRVLEGFQQHGLNLSSIESRPSRLRTWDYVFYVDISGHVQDAPVKEAIDAIAELCLSVKVLGSYQRA